MRALLLAVLALSLCACEGQDRTPAAQIESSIHAPVFPESRLNVKDFGADSLNILPALTKAIRECCAGGGGMVLVPAGTWEVLGPIELLSGVNLHLEEGCVLNFSTDEKDYLPVVKTRWEGTELYNYSPYIRARGQKDIALTGKGVLDARGSRNIANWKFGPQNPDQALLRKMGREGVPVRERIFGAGHFLRPGFLEPSDCENILIEGITILDAPFWVIHPIECNNVIVRDVKIVAHNYNTDGFDPESCSNVLIEDCNFETGDDCIAIKSGRDQDGWRMDRPTENVIIRNCDFNAGTNGICIGSEISGGVKNVYVENMRIKAKNNGFYFKSNLDRGAYIRDVHVRDIKVDSVGQVLLAFNADYGREAIGHYPTDIRDFSFENIDARFAGEEGISMTGCPDKPMSNIRISNLALRSAGGKVKQTAVEGLRLHNVCIQERKQKMEGNVNMFLGSSGDHGQMAPAACVPFGMVAVCPDSYPPTHAGYDFRQPVLSGISINRLSGVGCEGVGGNLSVKPGPKDAVFSIVQGSEEAVPGYYKADFSGGIRGEFTATRSMAVERYTFPGNKAQLNIDFESAINGRALKCSYKVLDGNNIEGSIESPNTCGLGSYAFFFRICTDIPFSVIDSSPTDVSLSFPGNKVEMRIAVSVDSKDAAAGELHRKSFNVIRRDAARAWKKQLGKVKVWGGTEEQRILLHTFIFRSCLSPMDLGGGRYGSWSIWDTWRTKFPLLVILNPERMPEICKSLVDDYGGVPTVRKEHAPVVLLDAWNKGISYDATFSIDSLEQVARKDFEGSDPGRKMELVYDLWALGKLAGSFGRFSYSSDLLAEAETLFASVWKSEFMNPDSTYVVPEYEGLYEGTKWQYRWACPQYIDSMAAWKGRDVLKAELSEFFDKNYYNQGNEPDIQTPFMFNRLGAPELSQAEVRRLLVCDTTKHIYGPHGFFHIPFVGRAFRNAPDGLAPEMDEDDGTMAAWHVFSQLGFYPLIPGMPQYELVSPAFDRVVIRSGRHRIEIRTHGRKAPEDIVSYVSVNGKKQNPGEPLPHSVFQKNSRVDFFY